MKYVLWAVSLVITFWIAWTVAPSEKVIYKAPEKKGCSLTGQRVYVLRGVWSGRTGDVIGVTSNCYSYVIDLDNGPSVEVKNDNLVIVSKEEDKEL